MPGFAEPPAPPPAGKTPEAVDASAVFAGLMGSVETLLHPPTAHKIKHTGRMKALNDKAIYSATG